jgi:hypothetical protein
MSISRTATLTLLMLSVVTFAGCGACGYGSEPDTGAPVAAATPVATQSAAVVPASLSATAVTIPNGPWTDLARRLVDARNLPDAVAVTREVLARGGVATSDVDRDIVPAIAPASRFRATPAETVYLARQARQRRTAGTMTAAELAQMLETFGWRFKNSRGSDAAASMPLRGRMAPGLEQAMRTERTDDRRGAGAASGASEDDQEAVRKKAMDRDAELIKQIQDATLAWQKARQGLAKAPPDGKAAAEAQLKQAWDARQALIQERGRVQQESSNQEREIRDRRIAASEQGDRQRRVQRLIGPDYRAGEQLMEMFAMWVKAAAQDPADPRHFTPLFLAEMGRLQDPPIDIAGSRFTRPGRGEGEPVDLRGAPRSQQLRLTLLEIQLIAAAFHRPDAAARAAAAPRSWQLPNPLSAFAVSVQAQEPCSGLKEALEKFVGENLGKDAGTAAGAAAGEAASVGAGKALDGAIGAALDPADAAAFGLAMNALSIAARIGKLAAFYKNNEITVVAEPGATHKPPEGPGLVSYTASAGVSEQDWKEFEEALNKDGAKVDRALRDCMSNLGLPTKADLSDLAKEAENWLVEWRLTDGSPPHAWISLDNNDFYIYGRLAMKLKRVGPYSASAKLVVDILPEAERTGKIVRTYVTAQASLDAAGMPGLGTLVNLFKGAFGLAESLLDLCVGWYQFMNMPKAWATVEVDYHCPKETILVQSNNPVADGGGGDGPNDCLIEPERKKR